MGVDAMDDLALLAHFIERAVLRDDCAWIDDDETRRGVEMTVERSNSRARFLEEKLVNRGFSVLASRVAAWSQCSQAGKNEGFHTASP